MKLIFCLIFLIKFICGKNHQGSPSNWTKVLNVYNKMSINNSHSFNLEMETLLRNKTKFCLNDCSNNGFCLDKKCYCIPEYYGEDCSKTKKKCVNNCSEKGEFVNGVCICPKQYGGIDCSVSKNHNNQ